MEYIIIVLVAVIIVYVIYTYNRLITLNNRVKEAFSTMDVYLKKRWDLLPNLVSVVKEYSKYENETLTEIISLRNSNYDTMTYEEKIQSGEKISKELPKIMALVENYPNLLANENYNDLSNKLVKIEEDIANSRKYYNGTVRLYNNKIQMFPSNIVAKTLGYRDYSMFEAKNEEKENIKVEV